MSDLRARLRATLEAYDNAAARYAERESADDSEVKDYERWEDAQLDAIDTLVEAAREYLTTVTLPTEVLDQSSHILGLRTGWLHGDDGRGLEFDVDSGAGFGNPTLSMSVTFPDGSRVTETVDMRTVATDWVNRIRSEYKGEEVSS